MPNFTCRSEESEMMDDLSIDDERLTRSLDQLRFINRTLGGYTAVYNGLRNYMERAGGREVRILDVGTAIGDIPIYLLQESGIRRWNALYTGVDYNRATVDYANSYLAATLDPSVADRFTVEQADAFALPYEDGEFDIVMASMFLHHFPGAQAAAILREMNRVARDGVLINDLHRHPFAYHSIRALTRILPATEMARHDAPLSVVRGFCREELIEIAREAGLTHISVRWHWAFRWLLTSGQL